MIRSAIDDAVTGHFIRCIRGPQAKAAGKAGISGLYELKWDERGEYVKDPKQFRGFFAGEGNRTYIPNQFFDHVVPTETLAVVKVVGSVIRFSIGYANKWGHRPRNVALSYQHLQNYTRIRDRKTLSAAVKHALGSNFIERVEDGFFDPDGGKLSKAAVYALRWLNPAVDPTIGRKSLPGEIEAKDQSENPTGIGQKTPPAHQSENPTGIEIKQINKTLKQQETVAATFEKLKAEGFDATAAQAIASRYPTERVARQIRWLDQRHVKSNRLGLLRAAIEQDWLGPSMGIAPGSRGGRQLGRPNSEGPAGVSYGDALEQARQRFISKANPPHTTS